jgi:hypothetical protein
MTTNSGQGEKNHGGGRELIGHDERKKIMEEERT